MKENLNNTVIKVLSKEHGKKVIQWWEDHGVDTGGSRGNVVGWYYGLYDGQFTFHIGIQDNIRVIELPEEPETTQDNKLVAFLKKEGVYEEFVKNYDPNHREGLRGGIKHKTIDEYFVEHEEDNDAIDGAFKWVDFVYWSDIDDKWRLLLLNKPKLSFPREMWVWDKDQENSYRRTVLAKLPNSMYIVQRVDRDDLFIGYQNACELDELEELSVEQAEQKLSELTGKIVKIKQ